MPSFEWIAAAPHAMAPPSSSHSELAKLGCEIGITQGQADKWADFSVALEALQQGRRELLEATRFFGMDAPADVEMLIDLQAGWAKTQLDALNALRGRTHALCEVLTERQRHKANRLLQSLSMVA